MACNHFPGQTECAWCRVPPDARLLPAARAIWDVMGGECNGWCSWPADLEKCPCQQQARDYAVAAVEAIDKDESRRAKEIGRFVMTGEETAVIRRAAEQNDVS